MDPTESSVPPTLQALLTRHSLGPRWMVAPGPSPEQIELAVRAALRAPDHGRLLPWRVVLVGDAQRAQLADLFEDFARASGKDDAEIAAERERALNGPVLAAWVAGIDESVDKVPPHEQWICVGGALTNFLNALHLMGFAAKTMSGRKCGHSSLARSFCIGSEQLVAFVCIGTPTRDPQPREPDDAKARLSHWRGA